MQSTHFHYYQFVAWLAVFSFIVGTIFMSRGLTEYELYFASSLIGSTAIYSYFIRLVFVRFLSKKSIFLQITYFICQSIIGAAFGTLILIACILGFSYFGLIPTIPRDSLVFAINNMFWGNWYNMFSALVFWSTAYLLIIKVRQLYATKEALASSQLEALSQQLNPHFLFNTLNNIRASILEEPHKARDALAQLADMLRYTLEQHKNSKVELGQELLVVEEYIALCKIQFEERLTFTTEIEVRAKHALIPRMLLQLCVENAIKHGIGNLKEGGIVSLNVSISNGSSLLIQMTNPVDDSRVNKEKVDERDNLNAGVGLKNIKQRLSIMYAEQTNIKPSIGLHVEQNIARVKIVVPLEYKEQQVEDTISMNTGNA